MWSGVQCCAAWVQQCSASALFTPYLPQPPRTCNAPPPAACPPQLFPIVPIHRLAEEPSVPATLADLTCDSDGKVGAGWGGGGSLRKVVMEEENHSMHVLHIGALHWHC